MEGIFLFIVTSEAVLGVLGNAFIVFVNCAECARNKKLSKIGFILTGLATSRICLMWMITFDTYINLLSIHKLTYGKLYEYMNYLWVTMNHLSVWFATSLSIFYFLKIANFSHYVFIWLKWRTDRVFIFLVGFLFVSLFIAVAQVVKMTHDIKMQYRNISWQVHRQANELLINHIFFQFGMLFLFMIAVITCLLLIISLWRHNKQMQLNVSECRDLNTEAHIKAIKVLISFIVLFILYFAEGFVFHMQVQLLSQPPDAKAYSPIFAREETLAYRLFYVKTSVMVVNLTISGINHNPEIEDTLMVQFLKLEDTSFRSGS
ncbi:taste receptor type 2 member 104-like [Peromyscus leucopus]|uniref:taste receptor type 2 member 104-like n=1 Tax=Peromyscus leucopus TaxID=10041 RepID=UPI0010A137C7|nr:taste receptor type 2 member 104-like [Peromyscus leucopus]